MHQELAVWNLLPRQDGNLIAGRTDYKDNDH